MRESLITLSVPLTILRMSLALYLVAFFLGVLVLPADFFCSPTLRFLQPPWSPFSGLDNAPTFFHALIWLGIGAAILFGLNISLRFTAVTGWLIMVAVLCRNPLLYEIHLPYMGWSLLLFVALPRHPPDQAVAKSFHQSVLFCLGVSYSLSGVAKLDFLLREGVNILPSFFSVGFAFESFHQLFKHLSDAQILGVWMVVTAVEILALPLLLMTGSRKWIWAALTCGQVGLLLIARLNHISLLMVLFHLLALERVWIPRRKTV